MIPVFGLKRQNKIIRAVFVVIFLGLTVMFLYYHLKVGLVRYLDLDEVAHLHWSYNVFSGRIPYKDFFYIFTPFYLYLIAPLLLFTGKTWALVVWGRALSFVIYCLAVFLLFLIAKKAKSLLFALFTILIFAYLPMPADKWLEIRPDGLGTVLGLAGVYLLLSPSRHFWSGLFLSLGFVVNPKTLLFPLAALFTLVVTNTLFLDSVHPRGVQHTPGVVLRLSDIKLFVIGLLLPIFVLSLFFIYSTDFSQAFYFVFTFQKEAGEVLARKFPTGPTFYFAPNGIYYGESGISFNFAANLFIYVSASITATLRLLSFLDEDKKEKVFGRLLLSLLMVTNMVAYIKFFPLKHPQYLVAASPLVAYFFADFLFSVWHFLKTHAPLLKVVYMIFILLFIAGVSYYGRKMNENKATWTFADSQYYFSEAQKNFTENEYVWDTTGGSFFYKDPYYICCLPYGNYEEAFRFKLPDLEGALRKYEVKHIFIQYPGRYNTISYKNKNILKKFYIIDLTSPIFSAGASFDSLPAGTNGQFEAIAAGWYKIYLDGQVASLEKLRHQIRLDGKIILANPIYLGKGKYTLTGITDAKAVKIVYTKT